MDSLVAIDGSMSPAATPSGGNSESFELTPAVALKLS